MRKEKDAQHRSKELVQKEGPAVTRDETLPWWYVVRIAQKHEQGTRGNQEQAGMPGKES